MEKKVLVISGSARRGGNTDRLCDEFVRGAQDAGHKVEKICLREKTVNGCKGCRACLKNSHRCVQRDDMDEIYGKLLEADVFVLASPVYFYGFNSQTKAVIDRTFAIEHRLEGKTAYLIAAGAAPERKYMETLTDSFRKYIGCLTGVREGGIVIGYGVTNIGDIQGNRALEEAYETGKSL